MLNSVSRARTGVSVVVLLAFAFLAAGASLMAQPASAGNWISKNRNRRVKKRPRPIQLQGEFHAADAQADNLIHAVEARSTFAVNGNGLTAAVIDTGVRATHVDFSGRVLAQRNFTAENGGDPANAHDGEGHGTNVSGIILANGVHVGIAPGANLVALKVLDNDGSGSFGAVMDALDYVISNRDRLRITVVNLSLGDESNVKSAVNDDVQARIATLRNAGVAVCIAAGNDFYGKASAEGMGYPAIFKESVSVGAVYDSNVGTMSYYDGCKAYTTAATRICPFSQRLSDSSGGTFRTDVFAPGAILTSAGISDDRGSSSAQGTSQATPVTAGVVLLLQEYWLRQTGKLPTVDQIEGWLREGAATVNDGDDEDDNVANTNKNFPLVDALGALRAAEADVAPTYSVSGSVTENGAGLAGVAVSAGGRSATTGTDGKYQVTGLGPATISVSASLSGYTFSPANRTVTVGPNQSGIDFAATKTSSGTPVYTVSGTVTAGGTGLPGVTITAGNASVITDSAGRYSLADLAAGNYSVSASKSGYSFSPASQTIVVNGDRSGVDFTGTANAVATTYSIRGFVTDRGLGLSGVLVTAGDLRTMTTSTGAYTFANLAPGAYTVAVSGAGYTFSPASRAVTIGPDAASVNFSGSPVVELDSITLSAAGVQSGKSLRGTVRLTAPAATTTAVRLSSDTAAVKVPSSVSIKRGASTATFTIKTKKVSTTVTATVTAATATTTRKATLQLTPKAGGWLSVR